ncbi:hypothetical protein HYH03_010594 [Edaphochlamys debaryana]|uniref:Uncharacterized protein n=1 Tax=Edaphochlamys debaryana TaxID=47281 RepID=A0A835XY41_9CHLO|nr:hypothetical protein HYH03_010594 [Edaphochlamys debaryana]|eukprot:KAG2491153.1 hypothetical protein HYH03_010594 [Edaphochlamys debaryana]
MAATSGSWTPGGGCRAVTLHSRGPGVPLDAAAVSVTQAPCGWRLPYLCMPYDVLQSLGAQDAWAQQPQQRPTSAEVLARLTEILEDLASGSGTSSSK